MNNTVKKAIFEALDNAVVNGYEILVAYADVSLVAEDLVNKDAGLEHLEVEEVVPHILAWRVCRGYSVMDYY